jgi:tRNA dimethylallyltransferase
MERRVIVITGCTASGKGALARALARKIDAELLSVDSMKVYRGMDIGTAKPRASERAEIRHHLIDVADPWESFSAARFVELADAAIADAHARGKPVIAVGGTVMYLKFLYQGVFEGPSADEDLRRTIRARLAAEGAEALHAELARVDPVSAARIHVNDHRRVERALEVYQLTGRPISELQREWDSDAIRRPDLIWTLVGLRREKEAASRRINARVRAMIEEGLEEEARRIWSDPRGVSPQAAQAVGYAEWFAHFRGAMSRTDAIERIKINSRQLAKHQRTWLRRFSGMRWIDLDDESTVEALVEQVMAMVDGQ